MDGAHLCPDGAALLGLTIIDALRDRFDLPAHRPRPNGAWVHGTWREDPVYTVSKSFDARTLELTSDVCPPSA